MVDRPRQVEADLAAEQPYDASDPVAVNRERKKAARIRRDRLEFVKAMMDLPQGRAWVNDLLVACHMWSPSFTPGDPHATSFKEGERNAASRILADIMAAAPDQYITMVREGKTQK